MSDSVSQQFENYSVYVTGHLRGANPGLHWGLFVPTNGSKGQFWHATNRSGGWEREKKEYDALKSLSLCVAYKVGVITPQVLPQFDQLLQSVPEVGERSRVTGEAFSCRTYIKDCLHHLAVEEVLALNRSVEEIEQEVVNYGEEHRPKIERGRERVLVVN